MQSRQIDLTINKMTKAQYNAITPNADEIYLITDDNGLTQSDITTALGYTPVNPSSLATVATTGSYNDLADKPYIPSGVVVDQTYDPTSQNAQSGVAINGAGFATQSWVTSQGYTTNTGTVTSVNNVQPVNGNVTITIPTVPTNVSAFNNDSGYITGITSSDVTTALGYTPYNSSNPNGYITSSALSGYATQSWVGQQGYITGIGSSDVTTALGYTPADADMSNISTAGKIAITNIGYPTTTSKTLSLQSTGSSYTAPSDGWIHITLTLSQGGYLAVKDIYTEQGNANASNVSIFCPVIKNETFTIKYTNRTSTPRFRFYYAKGSESEAS